MQYKFINQTSSLYQQAIQLRIDSFFSGIKNTNELINDNDERKSMHIVCIKNEKVVGVGRLTLKGNVGAISQMAVSKQNQHQGIGKGVLETLISKCKKQNLDKIVLSAREMAIPFYKKFKFESVGDLYPSKKTGIPHQYMQLILK